MTRCELSWSPAPNPALRAKGVVEVVRGEGLGRTYGTGDGRHVVLQDVDVSIVSGEFVAIVGASGSGKTTLLGLLGCLDRPDAGVLTVCGKTVRDLGAEDLARLRNRSLGFVFQSANLMPRASALDNAALPLAYAGQGRSERRQRAAEMLTSLGLADRLQHLPHQLSGGQQQRVAIARALVTNPQVVFADEPTGALDSEASANVQAILRDIASRGVAVVMVTHDFALGEAADRMIRVRDGRVERPGLVACA